MKRLDQVRTKLSAKQYSPRTVESYVNWTRRYVRFLASDGTWRHPGEV